MNPWPFIIAAYAVTALGATLITGISYLRMRRAEQEVDKL